MAQSSECVALLPKLGSGYHFSLYPGVAMIKTHRPWYTVLYIQVLIAIEFGILIGHFWPDLGKALKPLGDGVISLIKMMIGPVIFCTVVHGIGSMRDLKKVGRVETRRRH